MAEPKYQQTIYFPQSIRQQLKILAAENDMTVSEVATKAVKLLLEQENKEHDWRGLNKRITINGKMVDAC